MYRSGQGFGSFLPSPAVFSHGAGPRGREQGRSPSPGSGPGRRQHPVPGAAPPALPAGGRGEAGGGRPSSGAPSLPHPPIKKRLRCRSAGSPGALPGHRARQWARFWAGSASPGRLPTRLAIVSARPPLHAAPGSQHCPGSPGTRPLPELARLKGARPLSGSGAPQPRCAHPAAPLRGAPPLCTARTSRPSLPLHLGGRPRLSASDRRCRTPLRCFSGSWPSARPRLPRCRRDPAPRG